MSAMDHGAAHERIEELVLEPIRLAALAESSEAPDIALREHIATCPACRADLAGWEQLQHRLSVALPGSVTAARDAVEPVELPPSLRAAVIAAAREADRAVAPTSIVRARARLLRRPRPAWLGIAAAVAVFAGSGLLTFDLVNQRSAAEADARVLASTIAAIDRVLAAPDHRVVPLLDPAGVASGSISWSSQDLVVLTTALEPPPADQEYLCWLEEPNGRSVIGKMYFAGRTAYWIGSLDEWATFRIGPDTRFSVTLSPIEGRRPYGPEVLSADLGT
ncbi:MAG: anti-sigma factor [Candidatus Limnocylindrales bacterium]